MKVLLIGPLPPEAGGGNRGGIAHHVLALAKALNKEGVDVDILATGYSFKSDQSPADINIYGWPPKMSKLHLVCSVAIRVAFYWKGNAGFRDILHAFNSATRLLTIDKHLEEYDVIHVHGIHQGIQSCLYAIGIKRPQIVTIHSFSNILFNDHRENQRKELFRINSNHADAIINVSHTDAETGNRLELTNDLRRYVIHNGLNIYPKENTRGDRRGLIFVGSLTPIKRLGLLLEAQPMIIPDHSHLTIIGDGPERSSAMSAKGDQVDYRGRQTNDEVRRAIGKAVALVVPSRSESFGLVYVEAMLEGAAVIGYGPVIREFWDLLNLTDDEKELVSPLPEGEIDPLELASIINTTIERRLEPKGHEAMESIRQKAEKQFCWSRVAKNMVNVYSEVIGRVAPGAGHDREV